MAEIISEMKNIAALLKIPERTLFRLVKRFEGRDLHPPIGQRTVGIPPYRHRERWTVDEWILRWYFQVNEKMHENGSSDEGSL